MVNSNLTARRREPCIFKVIERLKIVRSLLILPEGASPADASLDCGASGLVVDFRNPAGFDATLRVLREARARRGRPRLFVRLAPVETAEADLALEALLAAPPEGVLLEGAESGAQIAHLGARLAVFEARAGLPDGATGIVAMAAGTPAAALKLPSFIGSSPRLEALAFARDELIRTLRTLSNATPVQLARAQLVLAAAATGIPALDAPAGGQGAGRLDRLRESARQGFRGLLTEDPAEIAEIDAVFGTVSD